MSMAGIIVSVIVIALIAVLFFNAARIKPKKEMRTPIEERADEEGAAQRLEGAIRFQTVSYADRSKIDFGEFDKLHAYLQEAYPLTHRTLKREVTEEKFLIYHWEGTDETLLPIALLAHQDVVPVNRENWSVEPFGGEIKDGYVYGRGTMDMKGQLIALFESVENLLHEGFSPARGLYLLLGADEETMGAYGAGKVHALLQERGVRLSYVFDEGGAIQSGAMMGIRGDIGLIGICEKGIMNVKVTAKGKSGHASMPPKRTAVGDIGRAVASLEKHQMKGRFHYAANEMFRALTPHMKGAFKFFFANQWLFGGLLKKILTMFPSSAALLRTTFAPTQLAGSNAPNVLAEQASAVFNIRILPGETGDDALAHIEKYAPGVEKKTLYRYDPSLVSNIDAPEYKLVEGAVKDAFPELTVAPYPVVATTDSRYYYSICDNVFRFVPFPSIKEDLGRVHGDDERLSIKSLGRGIRFFMHLIRVSCQA